MKEALFYERLKDNTVKCNLCFHGCVLKDGKTGLCLARRNVEGKLIAQTYGKLVAAHLDPIEKKPLYHFHPGEMIFSVAANGCNLACPFCQNAEISRHRTRGRDLTPAELIDAAMAAASKGIAYTYTEPLVWYEYVLDTAKLAHEKGLYNVIVSNGTINPEPLKGLLPYLDAANIDLKGDTEFYNNVVQGDRESTLRTIRMLHDAGVHVEITNLLIPETNDSPEQIDELLSYIEDLDRTIPLHLSRYFPYGSYTAQPTSVKIMLRAYQQAHARLPYVYLGNLVLLEGQNTLCPDCGTLQVKRTGYGVEVDNIKNNHCTNCGRQVDVVL